MARLINFHQWCPSELPQAFVTCAQRCLTLDHILMKLFLRAYDRITVVSYYFHYYHLLAATLLIIIGIHYYKYGNKADNPIDYTDCSN